MTVTNSDRSTSAVGTDTVGQEIPFSFPINETSDITVRSRVTATGDPTPLTETTNYTVTINGDTGGTVTMVTAVATTAELHIERNTPVTQLLDLVQGGSFSAEDIEEGFDKSTRIAADNADGVARSISIPPTDPSTITTELPNSVDRASLVMAFDATGSATAIDAVPEGSVSFSAYGKTIVAAADAQAVKPILNLDFVFDVRDFGATGDGVTDDTAAIQLAIDEAETNGPGLGGKVLFPTGTYACGSELTVDQSGITLTGPTGFGQDAKLVYSGSGVFISLNKSFCAVKNLHITGPNSAAAADPDVAADVAILMGTVADPKRENLVQRCILENWNVAIKNVGSHNLVDQVDILAASNYGFWQKIGVSNKLTDVYIAGEAATDCVFIESGIRMFTLQGCTLTEAARGVVADSINTLRISNCHFENLSVADVFGNDNTSTILMNSCRTDGVVRVASSGIITMMNNWVSSSTSVMTDESGSNWLLINNQNLTAAMFTTGSGNIEWLGQASLGIVAFTDADTTPDVNGGDRYSTNNSSAGNITDFDKGWSGQIITVTGNDSGLTTIVHGQGVRLSNLRDFTLLDGDTLSIQYDGTDWLEVGRSYNNGSSVPFIVCNDNQVVCNDNQVVVN